MDKKVIYLDKDVIQSSSGNIHKKIESLIEYFIQHSDKIPEKKEKERLVVRVDKQRYETFKKKISDKGWQVGEFLNLINLKNIDMLTEYYIDNFSLNLSEDESKKIAVLIDGDKFHNLKNYIIAGELNKKINIIIEFYINHPEKIPQKSTKRRLSINIDNDKYFNIRQLLKLKGWRISDFVNEQLKAF